MKKLLLTSCLILLILFAKSQTYSLAFNLEKGKKYYVETTADQLIKMEKLGDMNQKMIFGYTIAINDINADGNYVSTLTYERASMTNDKGASEAMNKASAALVGLSYHVTFDKTGDVRAVSGLDSFVVEYAKNLMSEMGSLDEDDPAYIDRLDMMSNKLKESFNDSIISKEFGNTLGVGFSAKAVKVGDTWAKSYSNSAIKGSLAEIEYKLKSVDGDNATIAATIKEKAKGSLQYDDSELAPDLKIKGSGTIVVNVKTGTIASSNIDLNAIGTIATGGKRSNISVLTKLQTKQSIVKN